MIAWLLEGFTHLRTSFSPIPTPPTHPLPFLKGKETDFFFFFFAQSGILESQAWQVSPKSLRIFLCFSVNRGLEKRWLCFGFDLWLYGDSELLTISWVGKEGKNYSGVLVFLSKRAEPPVASLWMASTTASSWKNLSLIGAGTTVLHHGRLCSGCVLWWDNSPSVSFLEFLVIARWSSPSTEDTCSMPSTRWEAGQSPVLTSVSTPIYTRRVQWFSNVGMHQRPLESWLNPRVSNSVGLGVWPENLTFLKSFL